MLKLLGGWWRGTWVFVRGCFIISGGNTYMYSRDEIYRLIMVSFSLRFNRGLRRNRGCFVRCNRKKMIFCDVFYLRGVIANFLVLRISV